MTQDQNKHLALLDALEELKRYKQERDDALAAVEELQHQLADSQALTRIGTWRRVLGTDDLFWSDQTYSIHGLDVNTPLTREIVVGLVHENDRARVKKEFDGAIADRRSFRIIYRIRRPDGLIRVLHADNMFTPDAEDGKGVIYGAVHDITDTPMSKIPEHLASPELPTDSLIVDSAGIIIRASGRFKSIVQHLESGSSVFHLLAKGRSHDDLAHAMDAVEAQPHTRVIELVRNGRESEPREAFELRPWSPFGEWWGFVLSMPADSTAVKDTDYTVLNSKSGANRQHLSGAWERDIAAESIFWTAALYEIVERDPNLPPLKREEFMALIHPEDRERVGAAAQSFDESGKSFDYTFRILTPSGKIKSIRTQAEYVDRTHPRSHILGTLADVTEASNLEREVRKADIKEQQLRSALTDSRQQLLMASLRLQTVQEQERFRIATELHDEAGGLLTALNLTLSQLEENASPSAYQLARDILDQLTEQVRNTTRKLRPSVLDRFGLSEALRQLANDMASLASWNLELDLPPADLNVEDDLTNVLYGIARESLLNAVKHAEATHVTLRLQRRIEGFTLEIEDDGIGMKDSVDQSVPTGLGLKAMRDRVETHGGTIHVDSESDHGTKVSVFIPSAPQIDLETMS